MARIKMHIPKAKLPFYPPYEVKYRLQNGVSTGGGGGGAYEEDGYGRGRGWCGGHRGCGGRGGGGGAYEEDNYGGGYEENSNEVNYQVDDGGYMSSGRIKLHHTGQQERLPFQ